MNARSLRNSGQRPICVSGIGQGELDEVFVLHALIMDIYITKSMLISIILDTVCYLFG